MMRLVALGIASVVASGCTRPADDAPAPPDGWFVSGDSAAQFRAVRDPGTAHGGRASARLEALGEVDGAATLMQSIAPDAYRGKRVRFSGHVETDEVAGWAGLWMRADGADGRVAFDNMQERAIHGTTAWTRHEVVLDVAGDAVTLQFGLVQDGAGASHLDDAALEVVGSDVAVTEIDPRPRALHNADFEAGGAEPDGWLFSGSGKDDVVLAVDRTEAKHGAASARLQSRVDHPRGVGELVQAIRADDYRGRRVHLIGWLQGRGVDRAELFAKVDAIGAPADSIGVGGGSCALAQTPGWQRCEVVFDVPADDSAAIEVGAALTGRGTLWVDDLVLAVVDRDVPLTQGEAPGALDNGDFENGDPELRPWFIAGGARAHYEAVLDRTGAYHGRASAHLRPLVDTPLGYGVLIHEVQAADYRGKRVRLRAAIKTVDARGDFWIRVQAASSAADGPGLRWSSHDLIGTSGWRTHELVIDVPLAGDSIQIGAGLRGRGTLWLDAVRLEVVDGSVPLTPTTRQPRALVNGDFEASSGGVPVGWLVTGGAAEDFEASVDPSEHAAGTASARLRPRVASPGGYGTLMQSILADDFRGKRLRMTALVKGEAIAGTADLWLRVQAPYSPGDGPGLGGSSFRLSRSFAWKPCEIVFDVPDAAAAIQLGIGLAGPGTLWLDDVHLDEVPRDVRVTTVVRARPRPVNLDFEAPAPD
jgi:hypothetical protein